MRDTLRAGPARWWRQPDHFDSTTAFLRQRGLIRPAQIVMSLVAASSAVVPLLELVAPTRSGWAAVAACAAVTAFTVGMTVFWLTSWPTRRQSAVTVLAGVACIAGWSLSRTDVLTAMLASTAIAITGAYIAFFHGLRMVVLNVAVAVAITLAASVRLYRDVGIHSAVAAFWLLWFLNLMVPLAIWASTRAMGVYAARADRDPLTGLLNRRGFVDAVSANLHASATGASLTVHLIDLDDFKRVNDTHGHPAGDRVLQSVADLLRDHAPPAAAVGRAGGEEFLIASPSLRVELDDLGPRICTAIAALPHKITASIGSAGSTFDGTRGAAEFIEELILAADSAMYAAKRDGGNRTELAGEGL